MGVKTGRLAVIEERKRGAGSFDFRGRNVLLNPPRYSAIDTHVQLHKLRPLHWQRAAASSLLGNWKRHGLGFARAKGDEKVTATKIGEVGEFW
jgi:hypothetical protein